MYQSELIRQAEYNYILPGLAYLKINPPADGWRDYHENALTRPAADNAPANQPRADP